jgi:hypothetical protein
MWLESATGGRIHCPPGEIRVMRDRMNATGDGRHGTRAGMNTTADRMHCPPGEIHAMRDGINATADRIYLLRQHVNAKAPHLRWYRGTNDQYRSRHENRTAAASPGHAQIRDRRAPIDPVARRAIPCGDGERTRTPRRLMRDGRFRIRHAHHLVAAARNDQHT